MLPVRVCPSESQVRRTRQDDGARKERSGALLQNRHLYSAIGSSCSQNSRGLRVFAWLSSGNAVVMAFWIVYWGVILLPKHPRCHLLETRFWIVCWVWVTCRRANKTRPGSRQPNRSITNKGWPKQNRLLVCWRGLLLETFLLWRFGSSGLAWAFLLPKPQ